MEEIAKLLRNARVHLLEHEPTDSAWRWAPRTKTRSSNGCFGARLPEVFIIFEHHFERPPGFLNAGRSRARLRWRSVVQKLLQSACLFRARLMINNVAITG